MLRLYDAHNHAHDARFGASVTSVCEAARAVGVQRMVVNGTHEGDWADVARLHQQYPDLVIPSFGLHPWLVPDRSPGWREQLVDWLNRYPHAIGEIGLDRWKRDLPFTDQVAVFTTQLRLAAERNLPASVHCLDAWGPLVEAIDRGPVPDRGFLVHSFGGSHEIAERLIKRGAYFSFAGAFARSRKERLRRIFQQLPRDRLLIETDAPDQMPPSQLITHPCRDNHGEPSNHPANLEAIYRFVAADWSVSESELATTMEANFQRLFGGVG